MSELNVSRKSIEEILSLNAYGQSGKSYIIPEYQRPYKWDIEKGETLWIDMTNFYDETKDGKTLSIFWAQSLHATTHQIQRSLM